MGDIRDIAVTTAAFTSIAIPLTFGDPAHNSSGTAGKIYNSRNTKHRSASGSVA